VDRLFFFLSVAALLPFPLLLFLAPLRRAAAALADDGCCTWFVILARREFSQPTEAGSED
jgi:hypothetical protein